MHTFPEDISPKVNVLPRMDFELAYYDSTVQHINHRDSPKAEWKLPC